VKESIYDNVIKAKNTDFEVRSLDEAGKNVSQIKHSWWHLLKYLVAGIFFGIVLMKSEAISWYRIQEMFRLESFHLYGVLGSAVITGIISVFLIKKFKARTIYGEPVKLYSKKFSKGQIYGGLIFGAGWALTGACPGPLFALIGSGISVIFIVILSAIAGTWVYGKLRHRLPH
jgi:uncharacterized membrane protein YedE/YeeE